MTDDALTEEEIHEAYETVWLFQEKVKQLRKEFVDDKLTKEQVNYIEYYLYDNLRLY